MTRRNAFVAITPNVGFNKFTLEGFWIVQESLHLSFINGSRDILTGDEVENFTNWHQMYGHQSMTTQRVVNFVTKFDRTFNLYDIVHWRFASDDVFISFMSDVLVLTSHNRDEFRNWLAAVGSEAPLTHQPTLFNSTS